MLKRELEAWWHGVDFYRDSLEGQLTVPERKALFRLVRKWRPRQVFEIGTWKGGGSTYILSSALRKNGTGELLTVELYPEFYHHAVRLYETKLVHLKPFVRFHLGNSVEVYTPILAALDRVDFLFLDGAEDADQTLKEFELFSPKLLAGSIVACHDWKTQKTARVKINLENVSGWEPLVILPDGPTGFAAFRKKQE
ncbi:MAG: class I SAM-dependent methyltransferase [Fibrobacterota bacterium]